jgi:dihydroorotate dehydrogenase
MGIFYRRVLKPILFQFSPDTVHDFFIKVGEAAGRCPVSRWLLGLFYNYKSKETPLSARSHLATDISKTVDGIKYRTPIMLAAGFDPDGQLTQILPSLSFGGEEVGSVTAHPCEGNPPPRFMRLVRNSSIVVYKGLRNRGVDALIKKLSRNLSRRCPSFVLGISIARTNDQAASVDVEAGIRDYVESFQKLNEAGIGDYYAINISCPNAYTGEDFTNPKLFAQLLPRLRAVPCTKPVYIKMPITIPWEQFVELADIASANAVQGLIIGNLNKNYDELKHPEDAPKEFRGGLSGAPTFARSGELIRKTRAKYGRRFTIIGVGGILTPDDAMAKFAAGAALIQLISGMVFSGPGLIKDICERYAQERI